MGTKWPSHLVLFGRSLNSEEIRKSSRRTTGHGPSGMESERRETTGPWHALVPVALVNGPDSLRICGQTHRRVDKACQDRVRADLHSTDGLLIGWVG